MQRKKGLNHEEMKAEREGKGALDRTWQDPMTIQDLFKKDYLDESARDGLLSHTYYTVQHIVEDEKTGKILHTTEYETSFSKFVVMEKDIFNAFEKERLPMTSESTIESTTEIPTHLLALITCMGGDISQLTDED